MALTLPIDPEANVLLQRSPLALVIGMVLDQQVPLEKAFSSPYDLVQRLGHEPDARLLVDKYDGDPTRLWGEAKDGKELLKRISELPGFGKQKAQIMVALLGKQYGVQPEGWREAAGEFGADGSYKSVADIVDNDSLAKVRGYKQQLKAAAKAKG